MNMGPYYNDNAYHNGDNNFAPLSNLETAIEQIKKTCIEHEELFDIVEDLAELIAVNPDRVIIGLENKLQNGERSDLFPRAQRLKNKFALRVAKNQMSTAEQHVYIQILSSINTTWYQSIHPKIVSGSSNAEIDQLIIDKLINPIHKAIVRFDHTVTSETVSGMLYFLTGKCHINWRSEC